MNRTIHGQHEKTEESLSEMHIYANRKTVKKKKESTEITDITATPRPT
jgi:hypothetical protein